MTAAVDLQPSGMWMTCWPGGRGLIAVEEEQSVAKTPVNFGAGNTEENKEIAGNCLVQPGILP
jgi:hypothetical protein